MTGPVRQSHHTPILPHLADTGRQQVRRTEGQVEQWEAGKRWVARSIRLPGVRTTTWGQNGVSYNEGHQIAWSLGLYIKDDEVLFTSRPCRWWWKSTEGTSWCCVGQGEEVTKRHISVQDKRSLNYKKSVKWHWRKLWVCPLGLGYNKKNYLMFMKTKSASYIWQTFKKKQRP